ncbi:calpain_family_cysteine_protease-like_protein (plasmid) [Leishmania braziliensis MHOM/BR/75/M2904]|uniref:Calpain_family_cysteine_protease-like_protein n=1 Tax=Leishmania braziliensis MHOM/BR/75/M2904 TaxID=420245 RepID=A0A3P3Z8I8_LEIBR|nr:calpain_family_cysteine_protease-like_protein [Leishmania braziliensis MHOM/BR/75/M2904]
MGNACCGCCYATPEYKLSRPRVSGKSTPCFDDGNLFKIVKGGTWYFYNDTQDYQMKVTVNFGDGSKVIALSDTHLVTKNDYGACTATVSVFPLETKAMVKVKKTNDFNVKFSGIAFTEVDRQKLHQKAAAQVSADLAKMRKLREKNPKVKNQNQLLKVARTEGNMYLDTSFPPTSRSLIRPGIDSEPDACLKRPETIAWRRPEDFLPKEWHSKIRLFSDISPKDIAQGQLGDCYYLCAVAALAEYDAAIKGIFKNHHWCYIRNQEQKYGAWRVNLNISGWWRTIIVDAYLPSVQLLPVFARNRNHPNELWVSFAEKAYAKAFGSYQAIVAGYPWQALEDLTGFPAYDFGDAWKTSQTDTEARRRLFDSLHRWNEKKYLICIATPGNGNLKMGGKRLSANEVQALFEKAGLSTGHAYSVLDVKHFPLHHLCMLKIRNPWGSQVEWTGDWGDDSPLWNHYPLIKLACRPQKKADGTFWMEWRDVSMFFDSGSVCLRRGNWFHLWYDYRVPGNFEDLVCDTALEIIVNKTSVFPAYISLHQKDRRGLPASDPDKKYAAVMLSISKGDINGSQQKVVANSSVNPEEPSTEYLFQQSRSVSLFYKFTKGHKYLVIPRRMNSTGNNVPKKKYVIALHTQSKVSSKNVHVNIVRLNKNNAVFKNVTSFDAGTLTSLTTVYQTKDGTSVFRTYRSDNLGKGKKQRNAEFELMM